MRSNFRRSAGRLLGHAKEWIRPWYLRNIYFPVFPARRPAYFDVCWNFTHCALDLSTPSAATLVKKLLATASLPGKREAFLFMPMSDWHFRLQRPHLLMQSLAEQGHLCFFLNPHLGREFRRATDFSPQIARVSANIFELHVRLRLEPVYHQRLLSTGESTTIADAIGSMCEASGVSRLIQVVGSPVWREAASIVRERSGSPTVYDCHDLIKDFSTTASSIAEEEASMIGDSDVVLSSAESLLKHCLNLGADPSRCLLLKNAVGTSSSPNQYGVQHTRALHQTPVVGYLGALEEWFDVQSVGEAAAQRPEWKFLLAGRVEHASIQALKKHSNIELLGEIDRSEVPQFLSALDVATIPFLLNGLTQAADPIKLYEYLEAGLPVVSSRLRETSRFSKFIHYYDSPQSFVPALEEALADRTPDAEAGRRASVAQETWQARASQLIEYLKSSHLA